MRRRKSAVDVQLRCQQITACFPASRRHWRTRVRGPRAWRKSDERDARSDAFRRRCVTDIGRPFVIAASGHAVAHERGRDVRRRLARRCCHGAVTASVAMCESIAAVTRKQVASRLRASRSIATMPRNANCLIDVTPPLLGKRALTFVCNLHPVTFCLNGLVCAAKALEEASRVSREAEARRKKPREGTSWRVTARTGH